jgi:predicted helicase
MGQAVKRGTYEQRKRKAILDPKKQINILLKILNRKYQQIGFKKAIKSNKGRINMATGTGKTRLAAAITLYNMLMNRKKFGVYVVQAPVILLTYQLMFEFIKVFFKVKMKMITMFCHSGTPNTDPRWEELKSEWYRSTGEPLQDAGATLNKLAIQAQIETAKKYDMPILLVTTYKSSDYIGSILREINILAEVANADEAHYLVSETLSKLNEEEDEEELTDKDRLAVSSFPAKKKYFFTATEKWTDADDGVGMQNEKRYGKLLFQYLPRQAIKEGYLTTVRGGLLKMDNEITDITTKDIMGRFIKAAYVPMERLNRRINKMAVKMVIKANGSKQLTWTTESDQVKQLIDKGVNVGVIGSQVGNWLNGKFYTDRSTWLSEVQMIGSDSNATLILVHLRILKEGFDVPGLNTFVPMSMMSTIDAIQNIGRVLRPFKNKKLAFVAVPGFTLNRDNKERFKRLIENLEDEYGWDGRDFVNDWMDADVQTDDETDTLPFEPKKKKDKKELDGILQDMKFHFWKKRQHKDNTLLEAAKSLFK